VEEYVAKLQGTAEAIIEERKAAKQSGALDNGDSVYLLDILINACEVEQGPPPKRVYVNSLSICLLM